MKIQVLLHKICIRILSALDPYLDPQHWDLHFFSSFKEGVVKKKEKTMLEKL